VRGPAGEHQFNVAAPAVIHARHLIDRRLIEIRTAEGHAGEGDRGRASSFCTT